MIFIENRFNDTNISKYMCIENVKQHQIIIHKRNYSKKKQK